ncbi:MAG: phytoene desaturase family protein [bacterium]
MIKKKVVVVGAGPGGLTASMLLASRGYTVEIFEKQPVVGGRNAALQLDGFTFDLGPTFLMMLNILEEMFELTGRSVHDYLDIKRLDPLYRLVFRDGTEVFPTSDPERMKAQIARLFPGDEAGYDRFMEYEQKKYERLVPCLQVPYSRPAHLLTRRMARALPYLDLHRDLFSHLGRFFDDERLKICHTFQAKYLGMSPWDCPATFSMIAYIEQSGGIHHPIGGLNQISEAMRKVVQEEGGKVHLGTPVDELLVEGGRAVGVRLASGEEVRGDHVVLNADFAHAMNHLVPRQHLRKWTPEAIEKKTVSCSTFMLYLGVDKLYDIPHHNIIFASDYKQNVDEIAKHQVLSEEPSFYVQNACVTDPTLAPKGQSTLYVLVPIANNRSGIPWEQEQARYREKVLDFLETRAGLTDLRQHIVAEKMITPLDWEHERDVYRGAVFNLGHSLSQMLLFRPHNEFDDIPGCYLVGGGTHPGSGLPTIYESGRISAGLILKEDSWL